MRDIAVITINYNSSIYTIQCVYSIIEKTDKSVDYSIVIVDNNSEDSDFENLSVLRKFENVKIYRNEKNSGYGGANMIGVERVKAKYFYFLNNDTILINDVLRILFDFMENNLLAGISSGQMYQENGLPGINFNYFPDLKLKLLGSGLLRNLNPSSYPKKKKLYTRPVQVPLLNGSSLFTRGSSFIKSGGFDTRFFLYCEEEDLAMRFRKLNQYCYLVPQAKYTHFEGKSSMRDMGINLKMLREFYLSQHYLYLKHYGKVAAMIWRITQFFRSLRKFYIHRDYVDLAFFILKGPDFRDSLREEQGKRTDSNIK